MFLNGCETSCLWDTVGLCLSSLKHLQSLRLYFRLQNAKKLLVFIYKVYYLLLRFIIMILT